jgi:DNA-binding CsgD family transcriptional regulator
MNYEIALELKRSEHNVRNYLLRIFDKLGISSRVELVLYAFSSVEEMAACVASKASAASA